VSFPTGYAVGVTVSMMAELSRFVICDDALPLRLNKLISHAQLNIFSGTPPIP
jgi:hypothetical protein